jgi:hypothetical protein
MFPTIAKYNQAIHLKNGDTFKSLNHLSFIPSRRSPVPIYSYGSGSYAVVFKASDNLNDYAIRCFISAEKENIDRYREIDKYLKKISSTWKVGIDLLENEIFIEGKYYPVLKMDWVEGQLLNHYITSILSENNELSKLQDEIVWVSKSLEENYVGHGDIQCGNIIISKSYYGKIILKLIDYDGLFVPNFSNKTNLERGRSEFQHPLRSLLPFNETIDRFSFWVILCALEALKYDKSLWYEVMNGGYNTLDNLLFTGDDFRNFNNSKLVNRLYHINEVSLNYYLNKLNLFCNKHPGIIEKPVHFANSFTDVTRNNKISSNEVKSKEINIISHPTGAVVLTSTFKRIGITPLIIDGPNYFGKTLIVSYNNQAEQVVICSNQQEYFIRFNDKLLHSNSTKNYSNDSISTIALRPNSYIDISIPNTVNRNKNISFSSFIYVLFAILIIVIISVIILRTKESSNYYQSNDYLSNNLAGDSSSIDTVTIGNHEVVFDSVKSFSTEIADKNLDTKVDYSPITNSDTFASNNLDAYSMSAVDVIHSFFENLNNNNCKFAWYSTFNPEWQDNGQEWFCSSDGFGTITKTYITEIKRVSSDMGNEVIKIKYYAEDKIKGNLCYYQRIKLKKLSIGTIPKRWMIVKLENIEIPYECELIDQ